MRVDRAGAPWRRGAPSWHARDLLPVTVLLALSALAWLAVPRLAAGSMSSGGHMGPMAGPTLAALGFFLAMWTVMMAAMMLPAVTPVVVRVSRLARTARHRGARTPMTAGYLLVWSGAGIAAYLLAVGGQQATMRGDIRASQLTAFVLLLAGCYQLTPLKRACLRRCRSPLALVVRYGEVAARGDNGALRVGTRHGLHCLGCCWALMAVMLVAGMTSLVLMGVVAALILVEKTLPHGEGLSRLFGGIMIVYALLLLTAPNLVPATA